MKRGAYENIKSWIPKVMYIIVESNSSMKPWWLRYKFKLSILTEYTKQTGFNSILQTKGAKALARPARARVNTCYRFAPLDQ